MIGLVGVGATPLVVLGCGCFCVTLFLQSLSIFASRKITRAGGPLESLGLGTVQISAAAAKSIRIFEFQVSQMQLLDFFLGLYYLLYVGVAGQRDMLLDFPSGVFPVCCGVLLGFVLPHAMVVVLGVKVAGELATDPVVEARKLIRDTATTAAAWDAAVVPAVLKLAETILPTLSDGFGVPLVGLTVGCWVATFGCFVLILVLRDPVKISVYAVSMILTGFVPLLAALPVAQTSTACDRILETLNCKRMATIGASAASAGKHHAGTKHIEELEKALSKLNFGQGLGFVLNGRIINVAVLGAMATKVATGLVAVVPLIIGLRFQPGVGAGRHAACSLTAAQGALLRSCAELALGNATATCSFRNLTLEAILQAG